MLLIDFPFTPGARQDKAIDRSKVKDNSAHNVKLHGETMANRKIAASTITDVTITTARTPIR